MEWVVILVLLGFGVYVGLFAYLDDVARKEEGDGDGQWVEGKFVRRSKNESIVT